MHTGDVQLLPSCEDMARVSRATAAAGPRSKRWDTASVQGSPYPSIHSLQSEEGEEEEFSCSGCLKSGKGALCVRLCGYLYVPWSFKSAPIGTTPHGTGRGGGAVAILSQIVFISK